MSIPQSAITNQRDEGGNSLFKPRRMHSADSRDDLIVDVPIP
jgi:hypothetical protein